MVFDFIKDNVLFSILFFIFSISAFIQLIYYWVLFSRLAFYRAKSRKRTKEPVSVVICAKDEYENLQTNLPLILEQDYKEFEVVVVNDASEDDTAELLTDLSLKYKNLKIVDIKADLNFFKGKKFPLSIGIKSAKNDIILLTDADCKPESKNWISHMQSAFTGDKKIVLSYGAYEKKKGILNKIIRFDTLHIAIQYLSYALAGIPYMG